MGGGGGGGGGGGEARGGKLEKRGREMEEKEKRRKLRGGEYETYYSMTSCNSENIEYVHGTNLSY